MKIKKYKPHGQWIWGEYDFYINNQIVAKIRTQLIGSSYMYVYFLPKIYKDTCCIRIDKRHITHDEALDKAIKIVKKKLYAIASNILFDIKQPDIMEGEE